MTNPLLDLSGLPRFDAITPEHVTPAYTREILEWDCPSILTGEEPA